MEKEKDLNKIKLVNIIPFSGGLFKEDLTYFTTKNISYGDVVTIPIRNKKVLGLVINIQDINTEKKDIKDLSFSLKKIIDIKKNSIFKKEYIESIILLSKYFVSSKNTATVSMIPTLFREKYSEIENIFYKQTQTENKEKDIIKYQNIKSEKLLFQAKLEDRLSYYKTLIRGQFAQKKSVFIVLPTEHDIKIFEEHLSKGIENFTFSFNAKKTEKKILEDCRNISLSTHGILILATAKYLSIPIENLETIILEHESSNAYKTISRPHFDLRIFAEIYASKINAKLILSDDLLRYETIARKDIDNLNTVYPSNFRTEFNDIKISIINKKPENKTKFQIFSEESIEEIKNNIKNKKNTFIFSLRKGLATFTICKDCQESINCEQCLAPLVLYLSKDHKKRMFVCNKCKTEKDPDITCKNCGGWNLIPLGIGVDTVYEEIKAKFSKTKSLDSSPEEFRDIFSFEHNPTSEPEVKIFKLDKESVKNSKEVKKIIKSFYENEGSILVGTEIALFYLKEKIYTTIIASFDSLWSIPNYKMSEKIVHLLLSMLDRTEKKIIIQTKNINDPAILAIKSGNLLSFVREEIQDRKILNYPPFKRFIKISFSGEKNESIEVKNKITELLKEYNPDIFNSFSKKDKYTTNALIKIESKKWSLPEISTNSLIDEKLYNLLSSFPFSFKIYVDPESLI